MSGPFLSLPLSWLLLIICLMNCVTVATGDERKTSTDSMQMHIATTSDSDTPEGTAYESGRNEGTLVFQRRQLQADASTISWQPGNTDENPIMPNERIRFMEQEDENTDQNLKYEKSNVPAGSLLTQPDRTTACVKLKRNLTKKQRHDGDTFPCNLCICSYKEKKILANCTNIHVNTIPSCLPKDTWGLLLSENNFHTLYLSDLQSYPSLRSFTMTHNTKLRAVKNASKKSVSLLLTELIINNNNIDTVDDGSFQLMPDLLKLNLGHNKLRTITNFTFQGLYYIQYLSLSHNLIKVIENGAFDRMSSLLNLDLSKNKGLGYSVSHFPPRLFDYLHQLVNLSIEGNSNGETAYPSEILEKLPKLQTLSMDGLNSIATFQPEVKTLKHLTKLIIAGPLCQTSYLNATFFENLPNITYLSFRKCNNLRICNITTAIAKYLRTLDIQFTFGYDLPQALKDMRHFKNSSLTSLALVRLNPSFSRPACRSLNREHAIYLQNLKLEVLDLSNNLLALLAQDFLDLLPKTLKILILRDNKFGLTGISIDRLAILSNLIELDLSYQNMEPNYFFGQVSTQNLYSQVGGKGSETKSFVHIAPTSEQGSDALENSFQSAEAEEDYCSKSVNSIFGGNTKAIQTELRPDSDSSFLWQHTNWSRPSNLRIIRAPYFNYFGNCVMSPIQRQATFEEIYLSHSLLSRFKYLIVTENVKFADLSNNYLDSIHHVFFPPNNSLVHLSLQGNSLGPDFADDLSGKFLAQLSQAQCIDVSDNSVYSLHSHFFIGLRSVRTLKIANNKLQNLNVSFAHMKSLHHLDLHKNSITWISKETRQDLDNIASEHSLTMDLRSNPLPCTCAGLELLYWMANTNVYFMHQSYLTCKNENNGYENLGIVEERVKYLQKHCAPKAEIIVICVACFVVVVILVGFSMMYRYRWRLRYLRNIAMAKLAGYRPRDTENHDYKFDAYVLFSDESRAFVLRDCLRELEVKRGHKLCINDRDFMPGTYEVSNIVGAIQHSAKTIAVVTPDFYEEEYSEYSIKMSVMEEIYNRRSVLHLCVYKPMSVDDMAQCPDLLMAMKRDDYTEFPPENEAREEIVQNFWDSLSLAIGHTNQVNALQDVFEV